jgi:hypothetical protein
MPTGGSFNMYCVTAKPAVFKALHNGHAQPLRNGHSNPPLNDDTGTYLELGWPLFPVNPRTRAPLIDGGFYGATTNEVTIADWLRRWPRALLGTPTGGSSRHIAVDVDITHPPISGFDALAELGWAILPNTPLAHSPSGGLHLHLDQGEREIPTTRGAIGAGIDVCGEISSIFLPSPGSAYRWDPIGNPAAVGLAPAPDWLIPPIPERKASAEVPAKLEATYAAAALADACRRTRSAPAGHRQDVTGRRVGMPGASARGRRHGARPGSARWAARHGQLCPVPRPEPQDAATVAAERYRSALAEGWRSGFLLPGRTRYLHRLGGHRTGPSWRRRRRRGPATPGRNYDIASPTAGLARHVSAPRPEPALCMITHPRQRGLIDAITWE